MSTESRSAIERLPVRDNRAKRTGMRGLRYVTLALLSTTVAWPQGASPVCISFNGGLFGSNTISVSVDVGGNCQLSFIAPSSALVSQVDICVALPIQIAVALYDVDATGAAFNQIGYGFQPFGVLPWLQVQLFSPAALTGGAAYILVVTPFTSPPQGTIAMLVGEQGGVGLTYQLTCGSPPSLACSSVTPSGVFPFKVRLRGTGCGLGPAATLTTLGNACGYNPPGSPTFLVLDGGGATPILGSTLNLQVASVLPSAGNAGLFWSLGFWPGYPIGSSPCSGYLNIPSLTYLDSLGLEPLMSQTHNGFGSFWPLNIPADPGLAGLVVAMQVAIESPNGWPTGMGISLFVTNAVILTLGYL